MLLKNIVYKKKKAGKRTTTTGFCVRSVNKKKDKAYEFSFLNFPFFSLYFLRGKKYPRISWEIKKH